MVALPPGVTGSSQLVLNDGQIIFLGKLRAEIPSTIPLYVTSGTRTTRAQAQALVVKRNLGDDLYKLYRADHIVKALMAVPNTVEAMTAVLDGFVRQGQYMSRHMRGDAVDLRNRDLTAEQVATIVAAARKLGARVNVETKPPHIHMEAIGGLISDTKLVVEEKMARVRLATGAATTRVDQTVKQGSAYATRQAQRTLNRAKLLYKQKQIVYTITAAGTAIALIALLAWLPSTSKKIEDTNVR